MSATMPEYRRGAINPVECLRAGWGLIKEQYWLFFGITLVGILIASAVPMGIIMGPMMCGIYICLFRRLRGQPVSFDMLFKGFDYFVQSLIATLIQIVPVLVLMIPLDIFFIWKVSSMEQDMSSGGPPQLPPASFFIFVTLLWLAMMVVVILVATFFIFSFPLIVDRKLGGIDAVKMSVRAVMGNLGGALGLMLLNMVLGVVGVLFCYVGAFFIMPISMAGWALAYERVFGVQAADPLA